VAIAQQYAAKDARIRVYVNEKNLGDYPNRNQAASYAIGKYLKYLDADDLIYPHSLGVMVAAMEQYPEADFGTQYNIREYHQPYPFLVDSKAAFKEHFFGNSFFQSGPTGTIFKREAFFELGGFSGRRYIGDTEMWMKFSMKGSIVLFQPALIWWRQHEEQEIRYEQKNNLIQLSRLKFNIEQLKLNKVLFTEKEFNLALVKSRHSLSRYIMSSNLNKFNFLRCIKLFKENELGLIDFITGFKPYSH
jgi:glycosyltransferase involved in cell wall biosynthesis